MCDNYDTRNFLVEVEFYYVVTLCSVVVRYQRFGSPCCLHLQGELEDEGGIQILKR